MNGGKYVRIQFVNSESQVLRGPLSAADSLDQAIKILHEVDVSVPYETASFLLALN